MNFTRSNCVGFQWICCVWWIPLARMLQAFLRLPQLFPRDLHPFYSLSHCSALSFLLQPALFWLHLLWQTELSLPLSLWFLQNFWNRFKTLCLSGWSEIGWGRREKGAREGIKQHKANFTEKPARLLKNSFTKPQSNLGKTKKANLVSRF